MTEYTRVTEMTPGTHKNWKWRRRETNIANMTVTYRNIDIQGQGGGNVDRDREEKGQMEEI